MNNARKIDEVFNTYHQRLAEEQKALNAKLSGKLIWNSTEKGSFSTKAKSKTSAPKKLLTPLEEKYSSDSLSSEPRGQIA